MDKGINKSRQRLLLSSKATNISRLKRSIELARSEDSSMQNSVHSKRDGLETIDCLRSFSLSKND